MALNHRVFLMDRGGRQRMNEIKNVSKVTWGRVRDATSDAEITCSAKLGTKAAGVLEDIRAGRHEIAIFRGNKRVWEGPVNLPAYTGETCVLSAHDVTQYVLRTVVHTDKSYASPNTGFATTFVRELMQAELARKEALSPAYNILPFLTEHHLPTDAGYSGTVKAYSTTVWGVLDALAARGGIDYTTIGRAIHLWDTSVPVFGKTRTATEADFQGAITVSEYGSDLATATTVTDGQGLFAYAGGIDPYYGEWEMLSNPYSQEDGAQPPTQAELDAQAARNLSGRNPAPIQVRVPDNSSVILGGALSIEDLVPGMYIPVRAQLGLRRVTQIQKLKSMQVTEDAKGEVINVSMYPASAPDEEDAA